MNIYISSLSEKTLCFYINAIQVVYVEELKSGSIQVIDYYDTCMKFFKTLSTTKLIKNLFSSQKSIRNCHSAQTDSLRAQAFKQA